MATILRRTNHIILDEMCRQFVYSTVATFLGFYTGIPSVIAHETIYCIITFAVIYNTEYNLSDICVIMFMVVSFPVMYGNEAVVFHVSGRRLIHVRVAFPASATWCSCQFW